MRLERVFTHRLIRGIQVVLPLVVIVLIAIPAWNYLARRVQKSTGTRSGRQLPSGVHVHTQGFTYSQTEGGRTQFTVHAREVLGFKDNKELLADVDVTVNGATAKDPIRTIHGKNCSYDQDTSDIECTGNVIVHLDEKTIVRTEELNYKRQDSVVTALQHATLDKEGTTAQTDRLEYYLNSGLLKLDGNVHIKTAEHTEVETAAAVFQQKENWTTMSGGVFIKSPNGWVRGSTGRADLVENTYKPKTVTVEGNVNGESQPNTGRESFKVHAGWMEATMGPSGSAELIKTRDNAEIEKIAGDTHQRLSSREIDTTMKDGRADMLDARQDAHMVFASDQTLDSIEIRTNPAGLIQTGDKSVLKVGDSTIEGRDFTMENGAESVKFNTPRHATLTKGGNQESSADQTRASFDSRTSMLQELVQTGNFQFRSPDYQGHAQSGRFEDGGTTINLEGSAVVTDSQKHIEASQIRIDQQKNTFVATNNVWTVMKTADEPVRVKSARAESKPDSIRYTGNVELWRGDSYVKADLLDAFGQAAQGGQAQQSSHVHAEASPGKQVHSYLQTVRATSDTLDYDDTTDIIHYTGHVQARKQDMIVDTPDLVVNFRDNKVTDMVASGGVVVDRADKHGTGERAVYEAATDIVTLTGKNAQVRDKEQRLTQGARLIMKNKGETVIVESGNGDRTRTSRPATSSPSKK
jgi:LPS export ABC transporter protein LptC/lipopolysaccharide transport protein LptA